MASLSDPALSGIQRYIDTTMDELDDLGLTLTVDEDLRSWAGFLSRQEQTHGVATTHDPARSYVHPGNSFWIHFRDETGQIIACQAHRIVETDNLVDDIRTHRVFFDRRPVLHHYPVRFRAECSLPLIAGKVGVSGGLWILPGRRDGALSSKLTGLTRALSLRHFRIDWDIAFMLDTPVRRRLGRTGFGYPHGTPLLEGMYPPYGKEVEIQLVYMSADEILDQLCVTPAPVLMARSGGLKNRNV